MDDSVLAEMIASAAIEARDSVRDEIPRFVAARNIESLFHFTSINNLAAIVVNGFLGRESLKNRNLDFTASDQSRDEPILDGVCFSISRPNHLMVANKVATGHDMVLLELRSVDRILSDYNFVAIPGNFGSAMLKRKIQQWPEEFIGGQGLINLFKNVETRKKYNLPDCVPTDPQSEIIILEPLPWGFVKKIGFPADTKYSTKEIIREIVRILPKGMILESQVSNVFPEIDWKNEKIRDEYFDRSWKETWD
jgi:hypothetical protein